VSRAWLVNTWRWKGRRGGKSNRSVVEFDGADGVLVIDAATYVNRLERPADTELGQAQSEHRVCECFSLEYGEHFGFVDDAAAEVAEGDGERLGFVT